MIRGTIRVLVIAAAATAGAALAQPAPAPDAQQALLDRIGRLQAERGAAAEELIDPLRELALLYQEAEAHSQAVVALQEARQVMRVNRGLFSDSVDEALLLRQQIVSEKALGNGERVWNLQHELQTVARKHLDDRRMLPIFLELLDDHTQLLDEFSTTDYQDLPPGIYVPCTTAGPPKPGYGVKRGTPSPVADARNCPFGTWSTVVARLRGTVMTHYAEAIAVLIRSGDYASPELRDLEKQALRLVPFARFIACVSVGTFGEFLESDLAESCMNPLRGAGVGGWASLMRLTYYEVRSGAPAARARAYADLGDWYLRSEHLSGAPKLSRAEEMARKLYEQALLELRQGEDPQEAMVEIFAPELPLTVPGYFPNWLASMESSRFIDVGFAITEYGKAERIEILDSGRNATRGEERDLIRRIEFGSFRPRAVDGQLADSAPVVVRYYLPENPVSSTASGR